MAQLPGYQGQMGIRLHGLWVQLLEPCPHCLGRPMGYYEPLCTCAGTGVVLTPEASLIADVVELRRSQYEAHEQP